MTPTEQSAEGAEISVLFLDIGGVLLTNGWDRHARRAAAEEFGLDYEEFDERHHLIFDTYEEGQIGLEEYLRRAVFHRERAFSVEQFQDYMLSRSEELPATMELMRRVGRLTGLRLGAISNEGRELTEHRIRRFGLRQFMDFFICSCFVHSRKPDPDIYRMALDVAQVAPENSAYVEDRPLLVQVASELGIHGIHHTDADSTRRALAELGVEVD